MTTDKMPAVCDERCAEARGYRGHMYRGESACQQSKDAYAAYMRGLRGGTRVRDPLLDRLSGMDVSDCIDVIGEILHA